MNDLTPAESEAVRRLLADARAEEQMPPDVAARLDGVIAGLAADRGAAAGKPDESPGQPAADAPSEAPAEGAEVVPLRRRRWPQVLVAAAAVTATAMAGTQLLGDTAGQQDNASPASQDNGLASQPESGEGDTPAEAGEELPNDRDGQPRSGPPAGFDVGGGADTADRADLGRTLKRVGVRRLAPLPVEADGLTSALAQLTSQPQSDAARNAAGELLVGKTLSDVAACGPLYTVDDARFFAARYRGHVALVLAHPEVSGLRLVEVYDCEGPTPRRSAELVTLVAGE